MKKEIYKHIRKAFQGGPKGLGKTVLEVHAINGNYIGSIDFMDDQIDVRDIKDLKLIASIQIEDIIAIIA